MLTLHVESGIGMGAMESAAADMCALADMLNVCVESVWNGAPILCLPGMVAQHLNAQYDVYRRTHRTVLTVLATQYGPVVAQFPISDPDAGKKAWAVIEKLRPWGGWMASSAERFEPEDV
jgi:hypothetical protein